MPGANAQNAVSIARPSGADLALTPWSSALPAANQRICAQLDETPSRRELDRLRRRLRAALSNSGAQRHVVTPLTFGDSQPAWSRDCWNCDQSIRDTGPRR